MARRTVVLLVISALASVGCVHGGSAPGTGATGSGIATVRRTRHDDEGSRRLMCTTAARRPTGAGGA